MYIYIWSKCVYIYEVSVYIYVIYMPYLGWIINNSIIHSPENSCFHTALGLWFPLQWQSFHTRHDVRSVWDCPCGCVCVRYRICHNHMTYKYNNNIHIHIHITYYILHITYYIYIYIYTCVIIYILVSTRLSTSGIIPVLVQQSNVS